MGYGFYIVSSGDGALYGTRPGGYMVIATCDKRGCNEEIDRGLGYLCGTTPHGPYDAEPGCGRYFCGKHLGWVGDRGGCSHRQSKAWGETLSCMEQKDDDDVRVYCTTRRGHVGPHWDEADEQPTNNKEAESE